MNTTEPNSFNITQLTAVNVAKITTSFCLIALAIVYGIQDVRQIIYLCLHISYCGWWLLEQWIYPQRRQIFNEQVGIGGFISSLLVIGIFYALPGYLAFTNPEPISFTTIGIALPLYIFGTLINTSADIQKLTAKQYEANLVKDGIWRFSRNINYFGDLLRYLSFSVVAGSIWAYLVPLSILILYLQMIAKKEQNMIEKYPDYNEYQQSSSRLIPFFW